VGARGRSVLRLPAGLQGAGDVFLLGNLFFSWETYEEAKRTFRVPALPPSVFRRNVVVEGVDLNALIGRRFSLGGIEFEGTGEARPCHWMNGVVAPGAEDWLMGRGGLRTTVQSDGTLRVGPVELWLAAEVFD
jgi:MOSC domain-containing protein YiiM